MKKKKKLIGKVTEAERKEIQRLFERKNGLKELAWSIADMQNNEFNYKVLYEELLSEKRNVSDKFQNWWDQKSAQYNWESDKDCNWEIDFNTCAIYLVK